MKEEEFYKYNFDELCYIAVNYAITCEKGYKGSFDSWFNKIGDEWKKIANKNTKAKEKIHSDLNK